MNGAGSDRTASAALSSKALAMIERIYNGWTGEDRDAVAEDKMRFGEYWLASELVHDGLAERVLCERKRALFRLTPKGQTVREEARHMSGQVA